VILTTSKHFFLTKYTTTPSKLHSRSRFVYRYLDNARTN